MTRARSSAHDAAQAPAMRSPASTKADEPWGQLAGRGGRLDCLQDQLGRGLGLRHERDVRSRYLHDGRVGTLGHVALELRRDRLVLGPEQVPARQCVPCWRSRRRRCERGCRIWPLRRRHDRGRLRIDISGESLAERLGGEVEVGTLAAVRVGERHGPDRRPHQAAFELSRGAAAGSRPRRTSNR